MKIKPSQPILPTPSGARNKRAARARALKARRVTARRLLAPEHFQASLRLNPQPSLWMSSIAGLQAALAVLTAVVLLRHSMWPHLVGFAALGALAALFGRFAPLLKRHGIVWICAVMLTGAVFVTSLASWQGTPAFVVVLMVACVAGVATMGFSYWKLGGPGAVIIVFAAGAAALIAYAAGWNHPSWAAIGAVAVMQGAHLDITLHRALQRMAGTLVGALIVWFILESQPPFWAIVGMVVIFQFITEVVIGYNYALGQIAITPMALLMTYLAAPVADATQMSVERVFDTMLGAILGIVFAVVFSTWDDRRYLARLQREQRAGGRK